MHRSDQSTEAEYHGAGRKRKHMNSIEETVIECALEHEEKTRVWKLNSLSPVSLSEETLAASRANHRRAEDSLFSAVCALRRQREKKTIVIVPIASILSALKHVEEIQCIWRSLDREHCWIQVTNLSRELKITDCLKRVIEVARQQTSSKATDVPFYFYIVPPSKVVTIPMDSELCWTAETP